MNLEALYHMPKSNYAYAYKENELHVRLRTAKGDMDRVNIVFGSKFDWNNKKKQPMTKILTDEFYDYYQYDIVRTDTRIGYYFELLSEGKIICYTEAGLVEKFNDALGYCYYFQYPIISAVDLHKEPKWIQDTVFYQIFVERFYDGGIRNSRRKLSKWNDTPKFDSFFGGNLRGIIDRLDYLADLGINGLYLTPIFESPSNHKYDVVNYYEVDPDFGDKETLKELINKAHSRGIRIVLDAVFNHCSDKFPQFQDAKKYGKASKYFNWFYIDGDTVRQSPLNYKAFGYVSNMPKLNTGNPEVKKYLLDIIRYWTMEFHIDGWRLDVSDEVDHRFWRDFRDTVKSMNEDIIIIGENWHNAFPWLMGDQFDSVMNYPVTKLCIDYFAKKIINAKTFEERLSSLLIRYPRQVNEAMLNLLDSHDTERFLTSCNGDKKALMGAAAFLFGYIGMPCTYYGTEIGMNGVYDPGCRKTFDWNKDHWDMNIYRFYKKLITIRKNETALKQGGIEFISTDQVFIMKRTFDQEAVSVLINMTDKDKDISISKGNYQSVKELISGEVWRAEKQDIQLKVPAGTALYMKLSSPEM